MDSDANPSGVRHLETLESPGHCALHAHCATEAGTRSGGSRPNQDAFAVVEGVLSSQHVLASLLDGHGPQGHFIARHVRDRLPAWVASCVEEERFENQSPPSPGWPASRLIPRGFASPPAWMQSSVGFLELEAGGRLRRAASAEGALPPGFPPACASLASAFLLLDTDLCTRRSALLDASRVTCDQSGCAAVTALVCREHVAVAACGDSSAFLAVQLPAAERGSSAPAEAAADGRCSPLRPRSPSQSGVDDAPTCARPRYAALPMSVAHKVQGSEAERLRLQGGRVAAHSGEGHIPRVWPRAEDAVPGRPSYGLAVSRSFGDLHWKGVGVCASPDVVLRSIQPQDAFLLLCSDGVTDVMEGQRAVSIAADALHGGGKGGSAANAALAVNEEAKRLWASRFPRSQRDDITCIVLPLRKLS